MTSSIAIVGAGPRGAGILERLAASVPELLPRHGRGSGLDVHLIDPYPAGAGRIWRHEQSALLAMNSMAADVTMFTDDIGRLRGPDPAGSVVLGLGAGRARPLTTPAGWAPRSPPSCAPSRRRRSRAGGCRAPTSRWVLRRDRSPGCPTGVRVHIHRTRATGLTEDGDAQVVHLDDGRAAAGRRGRARLRAPRRDADRRRARARRPRRTARAALPAARADHRLRPLGDRAGGDGDRPRHGARVRRPRGAAVRGPRRAVRAGAGTACATSRRAPSRGWSPARRAARRTTPRRTTSCAPAGRRCRGSSARTPSIPLIASGEPVELRAQVWPLMAKEIAWGWYHELFLGHPERVRLPWAEFAPATPRWAGTRPRWPSCSPRPCPTPSTGSTSPRSTARSTACTPPTSPRCSRWCASGSPRTCASTSTRRTRRTSARSSRCCRCTARVDAARRRPGRCRPRSRAFDLPLVAGLLQLRGQRAARVPGARAARAVPGRVRRVPRRRDVGGRRRRPASARAAPPSTGAPPVTRRRVLVDARLPDPSASRTADPLLRPAARTAPPARTVLLDDDGTLLRNTGLIRVRPADGALIDGAGRRTPAGSRWAPHTTVKVAGALHPARDERTEPALQRRRGARRGACVSLPDTSAGSEPPRRRHAGS